jgi:hypothetical protein
MSINNTKSQMILVCFCAGNQNPEAMQHEGTMDPAVTRQRHNSDSVSTIYITLPTLLIIPSSLSSSMKCSTLSTVKCANVGLECRNTQPPVPQGFIVERGFMFHSSPCSSCSEGDAGRRCHLIYKRGNRLDPDL